MTDLFHQSDPNSRTDGESRNNVSSTLSDRLHVEVVGMMTDGTLAIGQRLPSVRTMSQSRGVSRDTVLRAYDRLVAAGRAHAVRGSGYFVAEPDVAHHGLAPIDSGDPLDSQRLIHSDFALDHQPGSGVLRHETAAQVELSRVLRSVVASGFGLDSGYGDTLGYLPLRQHFQGWLRQGGLDTPIDAIVTVPGAAAGIGLAIRALLRPGSCVLVERPCSFVHTRALLAQGSQIRAVPRLADGPDLDVVRELCEQHRPKMFVLSSLLHNPTGTSIALHKAQKLIELAAEFEMILLDDCSYGDLLNRSDGRPVVPLVLLDQLRWVIHVGGFSRTLSPAIGPGFIVAGGSHLKYIRIYRPVAGLGNTIVAERTLYRLLSEGVYRRRCERIRTRLATQGLALRQRIAAIGLTLPPVQPGMYLWLSLGDDVEATAVARRMLPHGFLTAPAKHFTQSPEHQSYMRFNVTTTTADATTALAACL